MVFSATEDMLLVYSAEEDMLLILAQQMMKRSRKSRRTAMVQQRLQWNFQIHLRNRGMDNFVKSICDRVYIGWDLCRVRIGANESQLYNIRYLFLEK